MNRPFRFGDRALLCTGLWAMAVRSVLQTLLDRSGHSTDGTDFALGVLFGVGLGLIVWAIWRNGRRGGPSTTGCAR